MTITFNADPDIAPITEDAFLYTAFEKRRNTLLENIRGKRESIIII